MQEDLLSLLPLHVPAGDSQSILSLLVLHKFPAIIFSMVTHQNKRFQRQDIKKIQDGGCGGHLGFLVLAIFNLEIILLLQCVSSQIALRFRRRSEKLVFKMAAMVTILKFQTA